MSVIKMQKTDRGFTVGEFTDLYGHKVSVQESSLATDNAIWLGLDSAKPQCMAVDAAELGIETEESVGWIDYPIPEQVLLHTRMHINQKQAQELIRVLQHFVDAGDLQGL